MKKGYEFIKEHSAIIIIIIGSMTYFSYLRREAYVLELWKQKIEITVKTAELNSYMQGWVDGVAGRNSKVLNDKYDSLQKTKKKKL